MVAIARQSSVGHLLPRRFDDIEPSAATALLRIKFSKADLNRIHDLEVRAKTSALTREEHSELEGFLQLGSLLTLVHSKVRMALKRSVHKRRQGRS